MAVAVLKQIVMLQRLCAKGIIGFGRLLPLNKNNISPLRVKAGNQGPGTIDIGCSGIMFDDTGNGHM